MLRMSKHLTSRQRRTRSGEIIYEDSKTGESQKDAEAYDLIMRDKERAHVL